MVVNVRGSNPDLVDLVLERAGFTMQMHGQMHRNNKRQYRNYEREQLDIAVAPRYQENEQAAARGNERHE